MCHYAIANTALRYTLMKNVVFSILRDRTRYCNAITMPTTTTTTAFERTTQYCTALSQYKQYLPAVGINRSAALQAAAVGAVAVLMLAVRYMFARAVTRRSPSTHKQQPNAAATRAEHESLVISQFAQQCEAAQCNGVHIRDSERLYYTIANIKRTQALTGNTSLCIVTAFDGTLTKRNSHSMPTHSLLQCSTYLPASYTIQYQNIVSDRIQQYSSISDRLIFNKEWRTKLNELLHSYNVNKCMITEAAAAARQDHFIQLRRGVSNLFALCNLNNIPVLISAPDTYSDYIEAILQTNGISKTSNIHMYAQQMQWHSNNQLKSITDNTLTYTQYQQNHNKPCVLYISSSINDAHAYDACGGITDIIRVGICDNNDELKVHAYMQQFDIVITSRTLQCVEELVASLAQIRHGKS